MKRKLLIAFVIFTMSLLVCGCGSSGTEGSTSESVPTSESVSTSESVPTTEKEQVVSEEEIYNPVIAMIADAVNGEEVDDTKLPYDLTETIAFSFGETPQIDYALEDLDQNGVKELVIGSRGEGETHPIGVYTIKDKEACLLSDLSFFDGILSDGTIHCYQGNGVPEGHPDGYFFKLDGTQLEEVSDPGGDRMEFDWRPVM